MADTHRQPDLPSSRDDRPPRNPGLPIVDRKVQPVVTNPGLVDWLESMWGPDFSITRLEIRQARERNGHIERLGPIRPPIQFRPDQPQPGRQQLVTLANEIVGSCQATTDAVGKKKLYCVVAYQFGASDDYAGIYPLRCTPKENPHEEPEHAYSFSGEDGPQYPTGPLGATLQFADSQSRQALEDRRFFLHKFVELTEAVTGHLAERADRQDRMIDSMFGRQLQLMETTEKLLDRDNERKIRARWAEVGVGAAERGVEMVLGLAPPIVNRLVGKDVVPATTSIERTTAANFIRSVTPEQARAAFGFQGEGQPPLEDCIFTKAQGGLLMAVAAGKEPGERIYELAPGSGSPIAISMEQVSKAQGVFPPEQAWPLFDLFQQRMRRQAAEAAPPANPPDSQVARG